MATTDGLDQIRSFLLVAEELSFRRAAERLHIDQSALTRRIQKLEFFLGFSLFERTTREVSLTPAGVAFHHENSRLLNEYGKAVANARRIADGHTSILRIAYMAFAATNLMPAAVRRFRSRHPHVAVVLQYERTQGQKLALANGEIDLGYLIGPFQHSEFETLTLADEPLYAVLPQGHPLTELPEVRPADLAPHPFVMGDMQIWEFYRWKTAEMFASVGITIDITMVASDALAVAGLVNAGVGITIYPESMLGVISQRLEARRIDHPSFRTEIAIAWRRDNQSLPLRDFIALAAQPEPAAAPSPCAAEPAAPPASAPDRPGSR